MDNHNFASQNRVLHRPSCQGCTLDPLKPKAVKKGRYRMASHDDFSEEIVSDGKPSVIRKRQRQVIVRLNDGELARFQELQRETSLTASGLVRRWIAEQRITSTVDIQADNEMRRQGGLFKHNAWSLGNRQVIDKETVNTLVNIANEIHAIAKEIRDGFQENTEDR